MNEMQKLAVAQALYKVVGAAVSTKDPDSLRGRMDAEAEHAYRFDGIKSRDIIINGEKVGTYAAKVARAVDYQPAEYETHAAVEDTEKLRNWLLNLDRVERGVVLEFVMTVADEFAAYWLDRCGELPDGCELQTRCVKQAVDAQPMRYAGTVLKVDEDAVARALAGELPGVIAGLLEGDD